MKESLMNTKYLKSINLEGKHFFHKLDNDFGDEGCLVLNQIFIKSKIEILYLEGKI
jgi:uncharacterized protein YbcC (UPF0753/DUF2309 family)